MKLPTLQRLLHRPYQDFPAGIVTILCKPSYLAGAGAICSDDRLDRMAQLVEIAGSQPSADIGEASCEAVS